MCFINMCYYVYHIVFLGAKTQVLYVKMKKVPFCAVLYGSFMSHLHVCVSVGLSVWHHTYMCDICMCHFVCHIVCVGVNRHILYQKVPFCARK